MHQKSPEYIQTTLMPNGTISLRTSQKNTMPAYRHVPMLEQYNSQVFLSERTTDGGLIIRATMTMQGCFISQPYFIPPHSMNAYEFKCDFGIQESLDDRNETCYHMASYVDLNDPQHSAPDYAYKSGLYRDSHRNSVQFTSHDNQQMDWRSLNFYNMVRYNKILYAGHHIDNPQDLLFVTRLERHAGMSDLKRIYMFNKQTPDAQNILETLPRYNICTHPLSDIPDMNLVGEDYRKTDIQDISVELCQAVQSYKGGMQYITPANYHRLVDDMQLKFA